MVAASTTTVVQRGPPDRTTLLRVRRDVHGGDHLVHNRLLLAGDLLARAFDGSARSLMLGALSARKASKKELTELRRMLDEYDKGAR